MNNEPIEVVEQSTTAPESAQTPEVAELSLAEYRASREKTPDQASPDAATDDATEEAPATDDASDDEEESESQESAEDEKPAKPAKKGGFQRKLEQKDREIADLKAKLAGPPAARAEAPAATESAIFDKPKPTLEQYDSIEQYSEALADWKADERDFKKEAAAHAGRVADERKQVVDRWNSGAAAAKKAHADYDKAIEAVADIPLTPAHQQIILESEVGPELAYALAKDRKTLEAISKMGPLQAAKAIAKLELSLTPATPTKATKTVSSAPAPIRPVSSSSATPTGSVDVSRLTNAQYRALRASKRI